MNQLGKNVSADLFCGVFVGGDCGDTGTINDWTVKSNFIFLLLWCTEQDGIIVIFTNVIFVPFRSIISIHEHQHGHYQNDGDFKVEVPGNKPMPSSPEPPSNSSDRLRVLQVELFIICCLATSSSSSSSSSTHSYSSSSRGD